MTRTAPRRAPSRRRASAVFDQAAYEAEVEAFSGEQGEATYANFTGFRPELDLATVYQRHAGLFSEAAIDGLRAAASGSDAAARRATRLLGFAVSGHLERTVAPISDQIAMAETTAIVMWRRERIPYRQAPLRVAEISDRDERNALDERYRMAMEAINGLREERWTILHAAARALGAADYAALAADAGGLDLDGIATEASEFLTESETPYFAALRRYLALIEIEGGDGTAADLAHLLRGRGWDPYFELGRLAGTLSSVMGGLGIDLASQPGITLDLEPRPATSPRALIAPVRVPGDVRLVVRPGGGYEDYAAALHELGHLEHFAHIGARLAPADRYVGDGSLSEGWAFLFQHLLAEPEWLASELRMPPEAIAGWLDFGAFRRLYVLRRYAAKLLYELRLHRGGEWAVHRAEYAGLLGLLTGVRIADTAFLADVDDNIYAARHLRAWLFEASVSEALRDRFGPTWWRTAEAGEWLRASWSTGLGPSAEDVVATLGYDRLDWRPVLRQIRAQLIGEMSGYGGPNITTRAGSRKV